MAKAKKERRPILDPAVAELLAGMEQRQAESQLPRKEREKKVRERAKIQARRDQRATYDLPPGIRSRIKELAEEERLPASQLVTLALFRFLSDFESGQVDLSEYKQPSRSPRYDWNLVLPEAWIAKKKKRRSG
jgi:hypothetical protein